MFIPKIGNKESITASTISIQHYAGGCRHYNECKKKNKVTKFGGKNVKHTLFEDLIPYLGNFREY